MSDETFLSAEADELERAAEAALRPQRLADFVGQRVVRDQLGLVLDAAKARQSAPDHVLLSGPPGLGKTTLAMIIAAEMTVPLRLTSGPAITHAGDLASILSGLVVWQEARMTRPTPTSRAIITRRRRMANGVSTSAASARTGRGRLLVPFTPRSTTTTNSREVPASMCERACWRAGSSTRLPSALKEPAASGSAAAS